MRGSPRWVSRSAHLTIAVLALVGLEIDVLSNPVTPELVFCRAVALLDSLGGGPSEWSSPPAREVAQRPRRRLVRVRGLDSDTGHGAVSRRNGCGPPKSQSAGTHAPRSDSIVAAAPTGLFRPALIPSLAPDPTPLPPASTLLVPLLRTERPRVPGFRSLAERAHLQPNTVESRENYCCWRR